MSDKPVKRDEAPPPYSEQDQPPPYSEYGQTQNSIITDAGGLPDQKHESPAWQPSNVQKPGDYQNGRGGTPSVYSPGLGGGSNPGPYSARYGSSGYRSSSYSAPRYSSTSYGLSPFYNPALMNLWAYTQPSSYRRGSSNSSQRLQDSGYLRVYLAVLACSFLIGMLS
ncbi:uncharacterized protein F5Z01DRAFT_632162 [Emericellopsis atlantica]|uniref:Uncharacterized protein n=1 Tax=Emericellopsis atlantica TaxID=2614577 RepID=A0A9P8CXS0_9HYPO|nr:uncharacterized protein F5Z01DRAFT_632162 [Emericellopsis atlantica]KAG9259081.1 hypothetical protein F5Z01DRAFT_632162 [Emericellopsis atlantica]